MEFEISLSDYSGENSSYQNSENERFEFDDYENEGFLNDENRCSYCHQSITLMPFIVNGYQFCDVICAHLNNLKLNISSFNYDKKQYDTYYKNGLLSASASSAYRILRNIDLPLLPLSIDENDEEPELIKSKYSSTLIAYVNQSM